MAALGVFETAALTTCLIPFIGKKWARQSTSRYGTQLYCSSFYYWFWWCSRGAITITLVALLCFLVVRCVCEVLTNRRGDISQLQSQARPKPSWRSFIDAWECERDSSCQEGNIISKLRSNDNFVINEELLSHDGCLQWIDEEEHRDYIG